MKVRPSAKRGRVLVEVDRKDEHLLAPGEGPAAKASPFRLKKILVPTDFSSCSRKALRYALAFAAQFEARLTLLYVLPTNYFVGSEFGPVDCPVPGPESRRNSLKELTAWAVREAPDSPGMEICVREGQPVHEIVRFARESAVDLILLSTHGRTGFRHVLMGSVAENVVRYAPCPVLVVREFEREFLGQGG